MNEDRRKGSGEKHPVVGSEEEEESSTYDSLSASRARNKTVMLTPEITGQVRALLGNEGDASKRDPLSDLLPPLSGDFGQRPDKAPSPDNSFVVDYGGDIPSEGQSGQRDPTGKLRKATASQSELLQAGQPSPTFSVNPDSGLSSPQGLRSSGTRQESPVAHTNVIANEARSKIVGFMISFDKNSNGQVYEIRAGRWLLTSRPTDHGEYILIDDESISPLHAIVRATGEGKIQILDQLSEFGTAVARVGQEEEEITGSMTTVDHGDRVRFGKRRFVVCLVPDIGEQEPEEEEEEKKKKTEKKEADDKK